MEDGMRCAGQIDIFPEMGRQRVLSVECVCRRRGTSGALREYATKWLVVRKQYLLQTSVVTLQRWHSVIACKHFLLLKARYCHKYKRVEWKRISVCAI